MLEISLVAVWMEQNGTKLLKDAWNYAKMLECRTFISALAFAKMVILGQLRTDNVLLRVANKVIVFST